MNSKKWAEIGIAMTINATTNGVKSTQLEWAGESFKIAQEMIFKRRELTGDAPADSSGPELGEYIKYLEGELGSGGGLRYEVAHRLLIEERRKAYDRGDIERVDQIELILVIEEL